jgi:four helix bundle protein
VGVLEINQNKMEFKFEKLIIWQKAMELGENINTLAHKFPNDEMYNLSSHIRRAADSIALNISEGSIGQSNLDFKKIISYSMRSLAEVVNCLYKAKRREYISEDTFRIQYEFSFNLMNMLAAFKKNIK